MYVLSTIYVFIDFANVGPEGTINFAEWIEVHQTERENTHIRPYTAASRMEVYLGHISGIITPNYEQSEKFHNKASGFRKGKFRRSLYKHVVRARTSINTSPSRRHIDQTIGRERNRFERFKKRDMEAIHHVNKSLSTQLYAVNTRILEKGSYNFQNIGDELYLFSAFYDDRQYFGNRNSRFVRMIVVGESEPDKHRQMFCYFKNNTQFFNITTKVSFYETCENHMRTYSAFVASCTVPEGIDYKSVLNDGLAVSGTEILASKRNVRFYKIEVINNKYSNTRESGNFSICIPPLFGKISPQHLIEFIEMSRILGAEHFTFYNHDIGSEAMNVLAVYERMNLATVMSWPLRITNKDIWYYGQSVAVWDCLYRNMDRFKYVAFNDIDEFLIPKREWTWDGLIKQLEEEGDTSIAAGYRFQSAFFEPDDSKVEVTKLNIFQTIRSKMLSRVRTKLLLDPLKVFEIGIHHLSKPMQERFVTVEVEPEVAFLHHYRKCDKNWGIDCNTLMEDLSMNKYKHRLLQNIKRALEHMAHLKNYFSENALDL